MQWTALYPCRCGFRWKCKLWANACLFFWKKWFFEKNNHPKSSKTKKTWRILPLRRRVFGSKSMDNFKPWNFSDLPPLRSCHPTLMLRFRMECSSWGSLVKVSCFRWCRFGPSPLTYRVFFVEISQEVVFFYADCLETWPNLQSWVVATQIFLCSTRSLGKWCNLTNIFLRWVETQPPTSQSYDKFSNQRSIWMTDDRHVVWSFGLTDRSDQIRSRPHEPTWGPQILVAEVSGYHLRKQGNLWLVKYDKLDQIYCHSWVVCFSEKWLPKQPRSSSWNPVQLDSSWFITPFLKPYICMFRACNPYFGEVWNFHFSWVWGPRAVAQLMEYDWSQLRFPQVW